MLMFLEILVELKAKIFRKEPAALLCVNTYKKYNLWKIQKFRPISRPILLRKTPDWSISTLNILTNFHFIPLKHTTLEYT